jgi:hypothetical protein
VEGTWFLAGGLQEKEVGVDVAHARTPSAAVRARGGVRAGELALSVMCDVILGTKKFVNRWSQVKSYESDLREENTDSQRLIM